MSSAEVAEKEPNAVAVYFGVPSTWVAAACLPALLAVLLTQTLFWGLVGILAALVVVPAYTVLRADSAIPVRSWFGVPALAVWLLAAASVAPGWPTDAALFSWEPLVVAAIVMAVDAVIRRLLR